MKKRWTLAFILLLNTAFASNINHQIVPSLSPMLKKIMPGIVNIIAESKVIHNPAEDFQRRHRHRHFDVPQHKDTVEHLGSGVIVDEHEGFIITNAHVVKNSHTITVTLGDNRHFKAKLIGADEGSDIAILQINAEHLTALKIADSSTLKVGDFVVAIGNPFGLNQTVTSGIVSALARSHVIPHKFENFIQTDASINPGNSGGALVDLDGNLVGINTAILSPDGSNVGIGFAIPSNMAKRVMEQLTKYGSLHRGLIGVYVQSLTPDLASAFRLKPQSGAAIAQVNPGSPADKAGLLPGDVIKSIDDKAISTASQIHNMVGFMRVGTVITLKVLRRGKEKTFHIEIVDPKKHLHEKISESPFLFGLSLRNFEEQTALHGKIKGVLITNIAENTSAWQAGLMPGDIITAANQQKISSFNQLDEIAEKSHKQLLLNVIRGSGAAYFVLK